MAQLLRLNTFSSDKGNLTVFENTIPGDIRRVFYIYGAGESARAGHRHKRTWCALICVSGSCRVYINNGQEEQYIMLERPDDCLILEPRDWHVMDHFSDDAILLVLANELYDKEDYIYEPYPSAKTQPELA